MLSAIVARDINLLQQLHVINNKMNFFGLITLLSFDNSILKILFRRGIASLFNFSKD